MLLWRCPHVINSLACEGAGSGGVRASRISAKAGARVAIAEESRVGGTCVIRGCIPKKLLVYARYLPFSVRCRLLQRSIVSNLNDRFSHFSGDFEDSRNFGWSVDVKGFDWKKLIDNKDKEIDRLNGIYKNLLAGSGVKLIEGRATLVDAHTVKVRRCNVLPPSHDERVLCHNRC
jgi:glutathione reductase (NADPH)